MIVIRESCLMFHPLAMQPIDIAIHYLECQNVIGACLTMQ